MSEKENNSLTRKTYYENPLGTIAGYWEEPGPRFVDPYAIAERKAIQEIEREENEIRNQRQLGRNMPQPKISR